MTDTTTTPTPAAELVTAAEPAPTLSPGNDAWQKRVTATKIPAILGVSPYGDTPYTMWHLLAGNVAPEVKTGAALSRGKFLEAGIANWWADDHPYYTMADAGTWRSLSHPWAYATPDRLLVAPGGELELLEVKTARDLAEWGEPGTDQIPAHYWAQVAWQAIVLGVSRVHVTVLGPWLDRDDYLVTFDAFELGSVLETVSDYVDTLPGGANEGAPIPMNPELDWATMLKVMPVIKTQQDVSDEYVTYREAKLAEREAKGRAEAAQKRIKAAAADAEQAVVGELVVAERRGDNFRFKPVKAKA